LHRHSGQLRELHAAARTSARAKPTTQSFAPRRDLRGPRGIRAARRAVAENQLRSRACTKAVSTATVWRSSLSTVGHRAPARHPSGTRSALPEHPARHCGSRPASVRWRVRYPERAAPHGTSRRVRRPRDSPLSLPPRTAVQCHPWLRTAPSGAAVSAPSGTRAPPPARRRAPAHHCASPRVAMPSPPRCRVHLRRGVARSSPPRAVWHWRKRGMARRPHSSCLVWPSSTTPSLPPGTRPALAEWSRC
jgi:hypothetical protein